LYCLWFHFRGETNGSHFGTAEMPRPAGWGKAFRSMEFTPGFSVPYVRKDTVFLYFRERGISLKPQELLSRLIDAEPMKKPYSPKDDMWSFSRLHRMVMERYQIRTSVTGRSQISAH
jgi:hypothetical protein